MKRVAVVAAVFLGVAAWSATGQDTPQKLDGTYAVKSCEKDGEATPPEELKKFVEVVIKDDMVTIKKEGGQEEKTRIRTDATKKPAQIDCTPQQGDDKDKTHPGIYKLEAGELTIVVAKEGERPKDFDAKGKGIMKLVLQKKGAADK
jgi:uncharacterized protein (TIGR03067 family)